MALWGTTVTADESKPKWTTVSKKKAVFCNPK